jgi:hypothetical protein
MKPVYIIKNPKDVSSFSYTIDKNKLFGNFILCAFIFNAYAQLFSALFDMYIPSQKINFILISQGFLYFPPLIFFFLTPLDKAKILIFFLIVIYILHYPIFRITDLTQSLFGVKNFFLPLFYIPIIKHVYKDYRFRTKFETALNIVFVSWAIVPIFEMISINYPTELYYWFRSLALDTYRSAYSWRSFGMSLTIHLQGIVLALASLYYIFKKKKLLFLICFVGLIMSTVKTWIIGFAVTYGLYILFNLTSRRSINIFVYFVSIITTISISSYYIFPNIYGYYFNRISSGIDNPGTKIMVNSLAKFNDFIHSGIMPYGFAPKGSSILLTSNHKDSLPFYYLSSEVFLYDIIFQIGFVMAGLWIFIIWRYLFSPNKGIIFKSQYKTLLFLSLFTFVHSSTINSLFIFITVMYFAESHKISRKVI